MQALIEQTFLLFMIGWIAYQLGFTLIYVLFYKRLKLWTKNLSKLPHSFQYLLVRS